MRMNISEMAKWLIAREREKEQDSKSPQFVVAVRSEN